jgi:hypothetical protein
MKDKKVWKRGETPYVEIDHIVFAKKAGDPIVIHLTSRGAKEAARIDRAERRRQACPVTRSSASTSSHSRGRIARMALLWSYSLSRSQCFVFS